MEIHYKSFEPLKNLYNGIRLNDIELIATNAKSIYKIINPSDEVIRDY